MLSAVILTNNQELNVVEAIESVDFCDEVVVIDDFSDDDTVKVSQKAGAKVFQRALNRDFSAQRNFGLKQTNGDWVLFIDADERVPKKLGEEILKMIKKSEVKGYYLARQDMLMGKALNHGETHKVSLLRLARAKSGVWQRPVHEMWKVKGKVSVLKTPLLHYPHRSLSQFLDKINFYTSIEAEYRKARGEKWNLWQALFFPPLKFMQNYVMRSGFLDGIPGLAMALMMSIHSMTVRVKLYEKK